MPYRERLHYWAIVRLLPNFQRAVMARFRKRSDAEGYWRSLRRLMPKAEFAIVFELEELAIDRDTNSFVETQDLIPNG